METFEKETKEEKEPIEAEWEEENQDGQDSWKHVVYQKNGKETFSEEIQSSTHLVCEHYGNSARNLTENVL